MLENFNVALTGEQRRRGAQPSEFLTHVRPLAQYSHCLRHRCPVNVNWNMRDEKQRQRQKAQAR